jgi:hypothetical protein
VPQPARDATVLYAVVERGLFIACKRVEAALVSDNQELKIKVFEQQNHRVKPNLSS